MDISLATWNINSVRLRMPLIEKFTAEFKPDVLCLQEIKCRNDDFPEKPLRKLGYEHFAINGQAGYHGVAIASRIPFHDVSIREFCGKGDSRHVAVALGPKKKPVVVHNFYVPAGGDEPDTAKNEKFAHKLDFLTEMTDWFGDPKAAHGDRMILVGDLNIAPLETDVWSHKQLLKVVSHTPVEVEHLSRVQASRELAGRSAYTYFTGRKTLHLVELSGARLARPRTGAGGSTMYGCHRVWAMPAPPLTL